jgi:hypothetical protein
MAKGFPNRPEHVPVASYHLLRRLDEGPIESATLFGTADEYAVQFLTSRKLARIVGSVLVITQNGRAIGEVGDDRAFATILRPTRAKPAERAGQSVGSKPLSETLLDAANNIDQLSTAHVRILIRQAAKVLHQEGEAREQVGAANDDTHQPHVRH